MAIPSVHHLIIHCIQSIGKASTWVCCHRKNWAIHKKQDNTWLVIYAETVQLGYRVPTEVGWWSAFIAHLEWYDKTYTRVSRH